jgi:hypothetical protein
MLCLNILKPRRANLNKTRLGDKPGEIIGYAGGRPFPEEPLESDPRAGEKIAWNFRYGAGETFTIRPVQWKYRDLMSGKVERSLLVNVHALKFKYRVETPPTPEIQPNPSNLLNATYLMVNEPMDLKNTQLLIQRYDNDLKLDDAYMYFGFQRRVTALIHRADDRCFFRLGHHDRRFWWLQRPRVRNQMDI